MVNWRGLRRWITDNITGDRLLALMGTLATVALGVLGIIAATAQFYFQEALVVTIVLVVLIFAPLLVLLREPSRETLRIPLFPYMIKVMNFTTDLVAPDGSLAVLRHEEEIISLRDSLTTLRRYYWGDWDDPELEDLRCLEPKSAAVVDMYKEAYQTMYLISLRHVYNQGDVFHSTNELTVRNGFTNPDNEYIEWDIALRVDALVMKVILPPGKVLVPGTAKLRVRVAGNYDEIALPADSIGFTENGRYQIFRKIRKPRKGYSYGIHWEWKDEI